MKKATKVLLLVLCAILLVVGSVAGTLAYLTSQQTVNNTFSVGQVAITMEESVVDVYGVKTTGTTSTNTYKLVPGGEYVKDPTITVTQGSEPCWLFINVENDIAAFEEQNNADKPTIAAQLETNGWQPISAGSQVYYHAVVDARDAAKTVKLFEKFWVSGTANSDAASSAAWAAVTPDNTKVTVVAYAIQSTGLSDYSTAWTALSTQLGLS